MKKSNIALLVVFAVFIPLTLYFGAKLPGRGYFVTCILIFAELLVPFFMTFGRRKPRLCEIMTLIVMCAIAIIGRVAIPIPHFKAAYALIMLSGIALGPDYGFMVGAVTAFVGDFFYGIGAYMPIQMAAYGAGGMLAGFIFQGDKSSRKPWITALIGFFTVIAWTGPMLDAGHLLVMGPRLDLVSLLSALHSGFPVNIMQGICTFVIMLIFGKPLLEKAERVRLKYGMTEEGYGL